MKTYSVAFLLLGLALAPVTGCAATAARADHPPADRELITRAQLEGMDHLSAYDAVRRLKPTWLRTGRGTDSLDPRAQARRGVRVYVDGVFMGSVEELHEISVQQIREIRHLGPAEATMEFGTDHPDGALAIRTR